MKLPFSYHVTKQSSECFCKNLTFKSTQLHKDVTINIYLYIGYNYYFSTFSDTNSSVKVHTEVEWTCHKLFYAHISQLVRQDRIWLHSGTDFDSDNSHWHKNTKLLTAFSLPYLMRTARLQYLVTYSPKQETFYTNVNNSMTGAFACI